MTLCRLSKWYFLVNNEHIAKRSELEKWRQKGNKIPACCCLFAESADETDANVDPQPDVEGYIVELFVTYLKDEKVAEEIFSHVPLLIKLEEVQTHAHEIHDFQT